MAEAITWCQDGEIEAPARNLEEAWCKWEQQFRIYFQVSELDKKSPVTQTAILLHVAGPDAQEIYQTRMHPTNKILTGIGHGKITPRGTTKVECSVSRRKPVGKKMLTLYITDQDLVILGRAACEELDLIRRVDSMTTVSIRPNPTRQLLIDQNKDVLRRIGQYDKEYYIHLQPGAIPVVQHPTEN